MPLYDIDDIKVLLVEDEPNVRMIIRKLLNRLGIMTVFESSDGGDGFMQTMRVKPHLVLCDIHMKPVGGIKYLATLRELNLPGIRDTPVIFLTSNAAENTIHLSKDLKVNGYLVKPVSFNDLKKNIERVLKFQFDSI